MPEYSEALEISVGPTVHETNLDFVIKKTYPPVNPLYPCWDFDFYWVLRVAPGSLDSGWLTDPKICIEALGYEEAIQGHGSVSSFQTASSF